MRRALFPLTIACLLALISLVFNWTQYGHALEPGRTQVPNTSQGSKYGPNAKDLDTILYYPADSFISTGDVNGDGKEEIIYSGRDSALSISDFQSFQAKIARVEGTYISNVNVVDLDGDHVGEIIIGQDNIEIFPGMSPILHVYKWDGKEFQCIFKQENLGEVARILKIRNGDKEIALIYSTTWKRGEERKQWVTSLIYGKNPMIGFRQEISGPVIFAGEFNGRNIIITVSDKRGLGSLVMNYRDGAQWQYWEKPKIYALENNSLVEIPGFSISYRGPIWGLETGSFTGKDKKEMVLGTTTNGRRELKFYNISDNPIKEIASITSSFNTNDIAGFIKAPNTRDNNMEQIITSDGDIVYYDGNVFLKKHLGFKKWDSLQNMAVTKEGDLYIIISNPVEGNDYAGNLLQVLLK